MQWKILHFFNRKTFYLLVLSCCSLSDEDDDDEEAWLLAFLPASLFVLTLTPLEK